jgi:hypothetical protein
MSGWHLAHLILLGLWGGVVLAEGIIEVVGRRDEASTAAAAQMHYWTDLLLELPLLAGVITTGVVLAWTTPLTTLHWIKIACGAAAIGVNLWCIPVVLRRHRQVAHATADATLAETGRVFLAIKLGVPPGLVALWLGFRLL